MIKKTEPMEVALTEALMRALRSGTACVRVERENGLPRDNHAGTHALKYAFI